MDEMPDAFWARLPGRMVETGWQSSYGLTLTQCCLFCRLWLAADRLEFDGGRHRCNKADDKRYRRPWIELREQHLEKKRRERIEKLAARRAKLKGKRAVRCLAVVLS